MAKINGKVSEGVKQPTITKEKIIKTKKTKNTKAVGSRANSDESYIIDLCDAVLKQKAMRQHRFDFLRGDSGTKLPVDGYYANLNLVIEFKEKQHTEAVKLF